MRKINKNRLQALKLYAIIAIFMMAWTVFVGLLFTDSFPQFAP